MNTKKQKNKTVTRVKVVPEWKYKLLLTRIDRQDKMISQLCRDVDDLTSQVRLYRYVCHRMEHRINRLFTYLKK